MAPSNRSGRARPNTDKLHMDPRPDRTDTKSVTVHANKVTANEFKILAIRNNVTSEALMHVGLAASFAMFNQELPEPLREKLQEVGLYDRFRKFAHLRQG